MKKYMLIVFGLVFLLILSACSVNEAASGGSKDNKKTAPSFSLMDVHGKKHSLNDYAGKKVYVKFWASWCSICLAGLEDVNTLAKDEKDGKDFVVLTIVSPGYKSEKETAAFKKWFSGVEEAPDLTVLLDEGGKIAEQFQVRGYPTSAYIDSNGMVVKTLPGHSSNQQIIETFKTIH